MMLVDGLVILKKTSFCKYKFKSDKILSLPELKNLFNEDELLVVKKGNRLSILPVRNDIAKILLEKI